MPFRHDRKKSKGNGKDKSKGNGKDKSKSNGKDRSKSNGKGGSKTNGICNGSWALVCPTVSPRAAERMGHPLWRLVERRH
jgi:hypothetical protein